MACFHPMPGILEYPRRNGEVKPRLRLLKHGSDEVTHWIKCGKCLGCRDAKAAEWAMRLRHESRSHKLNVFLTLTYDDDHNTNTLEKHELQKFWKRLRKQTRERLKYFACGEYGDRTHRPHYHAALFGFNKFGDEKPYDAENHESRTLNTLWGKGRVTISELTTHRMAYVTGYVLKKAGYRKQTYCDDDGVVLENPFQHISTGLGKQWVDKYATDLRNGYAMIDERKMPIPRYYTDRLKKTNTNVAEMIQRNKDTNRATLPTPDPARNKAAEIIREQRIKASRAKRAL